MGNGTDYIQCIPSIATAVQVTVSNSTKWAFWALSQTMQSQSNMDKEKIRQPPCDLTLWKKRLFSCLGAEFLGPLWIQLSLAKFSQVCEWTAFSFSLPCTHPNETFCQHFLNTSCPLMRKPMHFFSKAVWQLTTESPPPSFNNRISTTFF
jgi:hypothetical protein